LRDRLLSSINSDLNRCIEYLPAIQVLEDGVVRIQYVHGCGDFEKADVGATMWLILRRVVADVNDAAEQVPTVKIHAFTRNGSYLFTSVTSPKEIERLKQKEIGFDDWLIRVGEGPRKLAPSAAEYAYIKALPTVPSELKEPAGDELKTDLVASVEDLKCVEEVSKLVLGKTTTVGYREVCGNFEENDVKLTMYEASVRIIHSYVKSRVWSGLDISGRTANGGYLFRQQVPSQILRGIAERNVGIVDWMTQSWAQRQGAMERRAGASLDE
jgi:hypothetical protein